MCYKVWGLIYCTNSIVWGVHETTTANVIAELLQANTRMPKGGEWQTDIKVLGIAIVPQMSRCRVITLCKFQTKGVHNL